MSTKNQVELLLTENVDNLGIVGDVVKVRPGYARNYLLPHGLATRPTEGAKKRVAERRAQVEAELKARRASQEKLIEQLASVEITLQRSHNEEGQLYGSVTQHDIVEALAAEGHRITERDVRIGAPIKRLDSYKIPIQLAADLKTEIKLWVVSDKPAEELGEAPAAATTAAAEKSAEQA
jgi:large subunit ribosomal protein L9